jgi:hypothetical protein
MGRSGPTRARAARVRSRVDGRARAHELDLAHGAVGAALGSHLPRRPGRASEISAHSDQLVIPFSGSSNKRYERTASRRHEVERPSSAHARDPGRQVVVHRERLEYQYRMGHDNVILGRRPQLSVACMHCSQLTSVSTHGAADVVFSRSLFRCLWFSMNLPNQAWVANCPASPFNLQVRAGFAPVSEHRISDQVRHNNVTVGSGVLHTHLRRRWAPTDALLHGVLETCARSRAGLGQISAPDCSFP